MTWLMQKKNSRTEKGRPSACYTEAIWRDGGKTTYTVSLGFLNEAERDAALARLRAWGQRLLAVVPEDGMLRPLAEEGIAGNPFPAPGPAIPGTRVLTKEDIRHVALHDHGEGGVAELMARDAVSRAMDSGNFETLSLADFVGSWDRESQVVSGIYAPVRKSVQKMPNFVREMDIWRLILAVLGGVKMKNVSKARWDSFLASRTSWSPRTKSIAQQHYQRVLKYAVSVNALAAVHPLDKIDGANERVLEPGDSLLEHEVVAVLRAARGLHRPLFAVAIGNGTRPGEVVILDWKDVDWSRNLIRFQAFEGRRRIRGKNKKADKWVPMTDMTADYLREWWEVCGQPSEGRVFTWRGKPFVSWKTAWKNVLKRAGIDTKSRRIVPYSARYTYCSLGVAAGIPQAVMRTGMRHASTSVVMETVYERLHDEQVRTAFRAFPSGR